MRAERADQHREAAGHRVWPASARRRLDLGAHSPDRRRAAERLRGSEAAGQLVAREPGDPRRVVQDGARPGGVEWAQAVERSRVGLADREEDGVVVRHRGGERQARHDVEQDQVDVDLAGDEVERRVDHEIAGRDEREQAQR